MLAQFILFIVHRGLTTPSSTSCSMGACRLVDLLRRAVVLVPTADHCLFSASLNQDQSCSRWLPSCLQGFFTIFSCFLSVELLPSHHTSSAMLHCLNSHFEMNCVSCLSVLSSPSFCFETYCLHHQEHTANLVIHWLCSKLFLISATHVVFAPLNANQHKMWQTDNILLNFQSKSHDTLKVIMNFWRKKVSLNKMQMNHSSLLIHNAETTRSDLIQCLRLAHLTELA